MRLLCLLLIMTANSAYSEEIKARELIWVPWLDEINNESRGNMKVQVYLDSVQNTDKSYRLIIHIGGRVIIDKVKIQLVDKEITIFESDDLLAGIKHANGVISIDVDLKDHLPESIKLKYFKTLTQ